MKCIGEKNIYIGLMSGTSVDGIDIAAVKITKSDDKPKCELIAFENVKYEEETRNLIFELFDYKHATVDKLARMNFYLGKVYGEATKNFIDKHCIDKNEIVAIGSHGQTIYHEPDGLTPCTLQIGEGSVISRITGCMCVSDFRVADIAAGGNGAPLVPFTEYVLYARKDKSIILQNVGGIANSTILPAGCSPDEVFAFDNGPGNMIIDALMKRYFGKTMDEKGNTAKQGKVIEKMLESLLSEPYYKKQLPKTTGRELFGEKYAEMIAEKWKDENPVDIIATVTALSAKVIAESYKTYVKDVCQVHELIVGGGGSYNEAFMSFLRSYMKEYGVSVFTQDEKGQNSDAKEAVAFALLAYYTLNGIPNNLCSATGAKHPAVLGKISF